VPATQQGHALGLFLYAFGGIAAYMLLASFRTNLVTVAALACLTVTLFRLAIGNYELTLSLVRAGGHTGLVLTALAVYLSASSVFEAAYGRDVLPTGDLSKE
jgi:succinate-acetate transporter protein